MGFRYPLSRRLNMVNYCVAFNCRTKAGQGYSFHRFPKDERLCKAWCLAVRRKNFTPTESSKICSRHFTKDDFHSKCFGYPKLKEGCIPSVFNFPEKGPIKSRKLALNGNNRENQLCNSTASTSDHENSSSGDTGASSTSGKTKKISRKRPRKAYLGDTPEKDSEGKQETDRQHCDTGATIESPNEEIEKISPKLPCKAHSGVFVVVNSKGPKETDHEKSTAGTTIESHSGKIEKISHKRPRKIFFGDYEAKDLTSPTTAQKFLQLATADHLKKIKLISNLRRKNSRLSERLMNMHTFIKWLKEKILLDADARNSNKKSDTTSVDHDVSAHLELELTTSDSTDSEIKIKEEPMSDTEEEGGALGFLDVRSLSTQADESSQHPGVSTTLVPSVFSVCTLSKPPPGEILGVPVGDLPMCPGLPSPPGANSSATTGVKDNNTSQSSANSINDTDEETKVVPEYRTRDQFDVYGEYIATKLRGLDLRTSAYVQKAFADILFEAEMGKYSSHTNLQG